MRRFLLLSALLVSLPISVSAKNADTPNAAAAQDSPTGVVMTRLFPPVYPPLARQARVVGDVRIQLTIGTDGSVESAEVVSGHPMLKQAALDSAQKSQFECRRCTDSGMSYSLTYTFGFLDNGYRKVDQERSVHSSKCLFLWKCGMRRSTSWLCPENRPPAVTQSQGQVAILVSTTCVETEASY
ncbi:MAG TPA: energy transducer TonB [Candidatus Sulfotelmatobacter sp.]|jgi:TonB family protein